jgi:hypothetical protein
MDRSTQPQKRLRNHAVANGLQHSAPEAPTEPFAVANGSQHSALEATDRTICRSQWMVALTPQLAWLLTSPYLRDLIVLVWIESRIE